MRSNLTSQPVPVQELAALSAGDLDRLRAAINKSLSQRAQSSDDALRELADAVARQGVLARMPTTGWATLTATCPYCGVEIQTALEPDHLPSVFEMTPQAQAVGSLRHSLFGHLQAYHKEVAQVAKRRHG